MTCIAGSALLGISTALNAMSLHATCTAVFVAVAAVVTLPFASMRTMGDIRWIGWVRSASSARSSDPSSRSTLTLGPRLAGRPRLDDRLHHARHHRRRRRWSPVARAADRPLGQGPRPVRQPVVRRGDERHLEPRLLVRRHECFVRLLPLLLTSRGRPRLGSWARALETQLD